MNKVMCLFLKRLGGPLSAEVTEGGAFWRVSSDGTQVFFEKSIGSDALGAPIWERRIGFADIPAPITRFIASALVTNQSAQPLPVFECAIDEETPQLVRELVGMPLAHAAKVMALVIRDAEVGNTRLRHALAQAGPQQGESVHAAAARVIRDNRSLIARLEDKLKGILVGHEELTKLVKELELKLTGKHALPLRGSLNHRACDLIEYLRSIVVRESLSVITTTVTVASSEPVLS
jgi:hypothetical protein